MICLFLDTSGSTLILSLIKDKDIIYNKQIESIRDHSTYLVNAINDAFKENNLDIKSLNKIFVGIGPGSFTGTRIGVTVAKTLSYSLNIDLIPVSTLEEYIFNVDNYDYYVPVIEDKKDKLYFSIFDKDKNRVIDDSYGTLEEFLDYIKKYDNLVIISDKEYEGYSVCKKEINTLNMIDKLKNREPINPHLLKPNYIKRIEAEEKL